MVLQNQPVKPVQQLPRLALLQLEDPLGEVPHREDALPPRDGVGPHDGVHGGEARADVAGAAPGGLVDGDAPGVPGRRAEEPVPDERGREALEEAPVRRGEAVVELVPGRPEGVAAAVGGELGQPQGGVVGGAGLELDVAVPGG